MQFSAIHRTFIGVGISFLSAEMQSAYSTAPADWAVRTKTYIDWLILMACQPDWGYFMLRGLWRAHIEHLYLHILWSFLRVYLHVVCKRYPSDKVEAILTIVVGFQQVSSWQIWEQAKTQYGPCITGSQMQNLRSAAIRTQRMRSPRFKNGIFQSAINTNKYHCT